MSGRATEPAYFAFPLYDGELINFEYSGGRHPGTVRTVRFVSWFWAWGERQGNGEGYLQAHDLDGVYKTYLYSKMSKIGCALIPPSCSNYETREESISDSEQNSISNWTSKIKEGDIIEFTYMNQAYIRNVTFINFMDKRSSTKRKMMCYENGYIKTFFINKMIVHKIVEVDKKYDNENSIYSQQEVECFETKPELLITKIQAYIDSQNKIITKLNEKCSQLQEECFNLKDEVQHTYSIMNTHKTRFPSTWETDFVPRQSWSRKNKK